MCYTHKHTHPKHNGGVSQIKRENKIKYEWYQYAMNRKVQSTQILATDIKLKVISFIDVNAY